MNVRRCLPLLPLLAALACGGKTAEPDAPPAAQSIAVEVAPPAATVAANGTVAFGAIVTGTANVAVTWSVEPAGCGTVAASGLFTAPGAEASCVVVASSAADPARRATATVTGTANGAVTWSVREGAAGGTITPAGLYTAPSGAGTYHVVATSVADGTKAAVASVTVTERVLAVSIEPAQIVVPAGGTTQFTATVTTTCGSFATTRTVSSSGVVGEN